MPTKPDIRDRNDLRLLVETFYTKIRKHPVLGPIFNRIVLDWENHFELLTDFWEGQLFVKRKYRGNPVAVHQKMDDTMGHSISPEHFGLWLNVWFATIDKLFEGETAWIAKSRAQKMSTMLYLQIYEHRQPK